jgi:hypothetical protein
MSDAEREAAVVEEDDRYVKLQRGMREVNKVVKASVDETARDWVALIATGDWSLDDVEARPYQEITDDEMRERVRQLRDAEDKHE